MYLYFDLRVVTFLFVVAVALVVSNVLGTFLFWAHVAVSRRLKLKETSWS